MKNLFIMHTQYNLLSALAVTKQEYPEDINDLAVIAEFNITEKYIELLNKTFHKVWVLQSKFDDTGSLHRMNVFQKKYGLSKELLLQKYDRVITSQEQYFDTLLVSKLKKTNPTLIWQSVEEDAYYSVLSKKEVRPLRARDTIKKIYYGTLLPVRFGKNVCHEKITCYGSNSGIETLFLTFPQYVRKELEGKQKKELQTQYLVEATKKLYCGKQEECILEDNSVIFLSDLISRYVDSESVYERLTELFKTYKKLNYNLYIKYHPRETHPWQLPGEVKILPSKYPSELILAENMGKNIVCIGNISTAVFLSSKFGYKTYSLVKQSSDVQNMNAIHFFERIGIKCI